MKTEWTYSSDLTNRQWQLIRRVLQCRSRRSRRPIDRRRVINAILYVVRTGCQWRMLHKTFPIWSTFYGVSWRWRNEGTWQDEKRTRKGVRNRFWGVLEQSHEGAVGVGTPNVQYTFDMSATLDAFDDGARLEKVTYPDGRVLFYDYGATGGATGVYDRLNRIKWLRETSGAGESLALYTYNGVGRTVRADYQTPDLWLDHVQGSAGTYNGLDRFGRVKDQYWDGYNTTADVDRFKYDYDFASNRIYRDIDSAIYSTDDKDQAYTYDGLHRLKTMDEGTLSGSTISTKTFAQDWTLSQLGNWATFKQDDNGNGTWELDQDRAHNDANEISTIEASLTHVAHDAAGNMTKAPKPGNWIAHYDLVYDAWNRLVEVKDGANTVAKFEYDGLHRRIVKEEYVSGSLDKTRHFYYSKNWQVLEERVDSATTAHKQYVWGARYIDDLVLRDRDADGNGSLEERLYVTQDALFNVTAVTNSSGAVQERFQYDPYGNSTVLNPDFTFDSATDFDWEYRFTGQRLDLDTGLQYSRYRYYHAGLGRFLNRDPIGYSAGDMNLFNYVWNTPLIATDPMGTVGGGAVIFPNGRGYNPWNPGNVPLPEPEDDGVDLLRASPPRPLNTLCDKILSSLDLFAASSKYSPKAWDLKEMVWRGLEEYSNAGHHECLASRN